MYPVKTIRIRSFERGLLFRRGEFEGLLGSGKHRFFDPAGRIRVEIVDTRAPWLKHADLGLMVQSGLLGEEVEVLDLGDFERALVWIDGRLEAVLGPGLHALFATVRKVRAERVDARAVRFGHADLPAVLAVDGGKQLVEHEVPEGLVGLVYLDGKLAETLKPGRYAFWKGIDRLRLFLIDTRESVLDVSGQEIMTADKVTLRLNALVTYRVVDVERAITEVADYSQALYREAQLALRAVIGTRELDALLGEKDALVAELEGALRARVEAFGVRLVGLGIRDLILPGDMRELFNRVTEARKAAEAALITRREETAAMRSQANTARLLDAQPTLMRLRELEVLEKIAEKSKLQIVLGERGLAERVVNLL